LHTRTPTEDAVLAQLSRDPSRAPSDEFGARTINEKGRRSAC
jgi:hypothetical protein